MWFRSAANLMAWVTRQVSISGQVFGVSRNFRVTDACSRQMSGWLVVFDLRAITMWIKSLGREG